MYNTLFYVAFHCVAIFMLVFPLLRYSIRLKRENEKLTEQLESQMGRTDLELATAGQIVQELVKRPNYRFMFIVPHLVREGENQSLNVEIHSSNVSVRMAVDVLRATYQGVVESIRNENPDEDIDELDE